MSLNSFYGVAVLSMAALCGTANVSEATVISGASLGYGASADVSLLMLNLQLPPAGQAQGTAPGPYSNSNSALSAGVSAGFANISTGFLQGTAVSNVDGSSGSRTTSASGRVDGASATVIPSTLITPSLVSLFATTIQSTATVSGDYGALSGVGSTTIEGLNLSVLGNSINIGAFANPNTVVFNSLGIFIVLNEQIVTGDGINSRGITVNAVRISFTNAVGGMDLLNGDIIFGHSEASMFASIPAPGVMTAAMALGGLTALRRRRSV